MDVPNTVLSAITLVTNKKSDALARNTFRKVKNRVMIQHFILLFSLVNLKGLALIWCRNVTIEQWIIMSKLCILRHGSTKYRVKRMACRPSFGSGAVSSYSVDFNLQWPALESRPFTCFSNESYHHLKKNNVK